MASRQAKNKPIACPECCPLRFGRHSLLPPNMRLPAFWGEKWAAGATEQTTKTDPAQADVKGKILEFAWRMKKQGYSESTVIGRTKLLRILVKRGANLLDPESVKDVIAKQTWSEGRKELAVEAYSSFLQMIGGNWNPPKYRRIEKLPFIPTEAEIDQLIAGCGKKMSAFLQLLKETAARAGEAWNLQWADIDFVNRTIRISPEKGSSPRIFKVSSKLLAMLSMLPKTSTRVFGGLSPKRICKILPKVKKIIGR
ncbi:tyrosine-type recombinase/integrase [Candidatus Bathyarchaeota archaeon]|nr:tyrosine-type recombinase/integrase [Candidatus Bathyarchaeota archaeon]